MKKFHLEYVNLLPSLVNTAEPSGAVSQLASQAKNEPSFDGVTIEQMRDNPLYQRCDDIDKIGLAQKRIIETAKTIKSNSKKIRALNDMAQKRNIPSKS